MGVPALAASLSSRSLSRTASASSAPRSMAILSVRIVSRTPSLDVDLDADEVAYLEEPYVPHTVAGFQ